MLAISRKSLVRLAGTRWKSNVELENIHQFIRAIGYKWYKDATAQQLILQCSTCSVLDSIWTSCSTYLVQTVHQIHCIQYQHPDAASHWSCSSLVAKARLGDGDQEKHINKLKAVAHKSGKVWELVDVLMETDAMAESDGMLLRPVSPIASLGAGTS